MICYDILTAVLGILGESGTVEDNADYQERAPYIIAAFINELLELDEKYCEANGLGSSWATSTCYISLDEMFPLSERFASACMFYVASMLIADENPELSETYYDRYCDCISAISASIAPSTSSNDSTDTSEDPEEEAPSAELESIVDVYGFGSK